MWCARARLRLAFDRIAPATSLSRFPQSGALFMGMRADDKTGHQYRSRSQLYMSSCGPCSMRGGEVLTCAPRSRLRARDRIAPATSSTRFELFGALPMGMCLEDRTEHRYRSRKQLYTSCSGPRLMRGGEVLARAPRSATRMRVTESRPRRVRHVLSCLELCP